jgi:hypothetical protein
MDFHAISWDLMVDRGETMGAGWDVPVLFFALLPVDKSVC